LLAEAGSCRAWSAGQHAEFLKAAALPTITAILSVLVNVAVFFFLLYFVLTDGEKLTLLEHYALDNSEEGCFCGAGVMAERLGRSRETIECHRRRFLAFGLLAKHVHGLGKADSWYPTLPPLCVPSSLRLSADQVSLLADRLDLHLARLNGGRKRHTTARKSRAQLRTTVRHSGVPPSVPDTDERSTNRRTTVPPELPTVGQAGDAGEAGEVGTATPGIRGKDGRHNEDDVEARYGL